MNLVNIIKKNPLYFAFLFPALVDGCLTLLGQGDQYWRAIKVVNEASPAYYFLLHSPWLFLTGSAVWFVFWYWIFKRLKEPINLFLVFLFIAGHSWGGGGWIMKLFKDSGVYSIGNQPSIMFAWLLLMIYFATVSAIATYCIKLHFKNSKMS